MEGKCLICGRDGQMRDVHFETEVRTYACVACGQYHITERAEEDWGTRPGFGSQRFKLSGITRRNSDAGQPITLTSDNIARLLEGASVPKSPFEALDRLLLWLHGKVERFDHSLNVQDTDYPVIFARNPNEFRSFLTELHIQELVSTQSGQLRLTLEGWRRVQELLTAKPSGTQAFVAMWFDQSLDQTWTEGFYRGLKEAGYDPVRVDLVHHNGKICDRIITEIRRSALLVADFTGNRGGVYFEAGYAAGFGIPVIWTCRESDVGQLHFDTRQCNHIAWQQPSDLAEKLRDRVLATIDRPRA